MASQQQPSILGRGQSDEVLLENALNALAKALKALTFYPAGHPQRDESVASAFNQLQPILNAQELVLLWSRDACTVADRPAVKSASLTAKGLAREMLTRKLQRLTILPEVTLRDLMTFLTILTIEASAVLARGGIETEMSAAGISTIGANEVDLDALKNRLEKEEENIEVSGEDINEDEDSTAKAGSKNEAELQEAMELDALLAQLKEETNEPRYLQLLRGIIDAAEKLRKREFFTPLVPALTVMLAERDLQQLSDQQREYVRFAIEQMTDSAMTSYLLDQAGRNDSVCDKLLGHLCAIIGKSMAYPLIQRLCVAESLHERKSIAGFLTRTGEAGIPALLSMLKDERWYVVRNMVTILGEIASPTALKALQSTAAHPEPKVRKEVIKSLLKISPQGAESTLVALIGDSDGDVVRQTIYSLGSMRARSAVRPLLEIITTSDPFLKELALKKQALVAIGRIGDRQATDALLNLLECRGWLAPRRWQELKISVANALGQMGDESAIPLLKQMARQNSPLGNACGEAADNLERLAK
ncbi:MAG TPA: HEAT repeat domain-containing protein [Geobacteraceae bacterium]|nr:HEAT repeat domain-containing protein [Geobacteraceae bacterium]